MIYTDNVSQTTSSVTSFIETQAGILFYIYCVELLSIKSKPYISH